MPSYANFGEDTYSGGLTAAELSKLHPGYDWSATLATGVPTATAAAIPNQFTTPDINSAFIKGWKPTGNQYLDYYELTNTYGLPGDWISANYNSIPGLYDAYSKANAAPATAGPLDAFIQDPTKYAPVSSSQSGLPDDVAAALKDYMTQATSSLSGYQSTLNSLLNPSTFSAAYKPVYDELIQGNINDLNKKGMISSKVASDTLAGTSNKVTSQYMQRILDVVNAMGTAANLPANVAQLLNRSSSSSTNQASAYETVYNILAGL
jgi:hypothetical protein